MVDFTEVLGKKVADVEKPKPKPAGTYLAQCAMPKQKTAVVQGEERLIISFPIKILAARGEDVDMEELADPKVGEISTWPTFNKDIWIDSPEGEYALRQFLTGTLALDPGKKSLGELCSEAVGRQFLATLGHRPYQDKNTGEAAIATDIKATAAV